VWVPQNKEKYFRGSSMRKKKLENPGLDYCEKVQGKITFTIEKATKA